MKIHLLVVIASALFIACTPPKSTENIATSTPESFDSPAGENASLPYLITGEDNFMYMSWVEQGDSNWVDFKYARLEENGWSEPQLIASGNDWFVNWADYPMIAVDKDGNMVGHYLAKSSAGTYSYDVNVVYKPAGMDWKGPRLAHSDGTATEHGFVTLLPQNNGKFLLSWLDGRNTAGGSHDSPAGPMTIRTALLDMNGELSEEAQLDERTCDCCQTGGTMTASGPVISYRDRSEDEIRDMSVVRKVNGSWSAPMAIHDDEWKIAGCPVNGPRMASFSNSIAVAWFTAAGGKAKVKMAFSNDAGASFNEPIIIDDSLSIGRVDVVMLDESSALVSWLDVSDAPTIRYRKVNADGSMGEPVTVSRTSDSRGSGFPQMAKLEETVYFAWTVLSKESPSKIGLAELSL